MLKGINIICGHYGSGKTNFSINLAMYAKQKGERVTVVDLDIVNPYFRTADYTSFLTDNGIRVISPSSAGTTIDAPALTAEMYSIFDGTDDCIIVDVGGDDVGASALGRFSKKIEAFPGGYQMMFVINKYRSLISTPEQAIELMREVEYASRIKATSMVNNSHLATLTTAQDVLDSIDYAKATAELAGLPLIATTAPKSIAAELTGRVEKLFPVEVIVKLPWN